MKYAALLVVMMLCVAAARAETYRWVDKDGKVHFGDRFPSAVASDVKKRNQSTPEADRQLPFAVRQAVTNFPVTLYVSGDCGDACKEGRAYLARRGVPFTEKLVATQEDSDALRRVAGGDETMVPVLLVGSKNYKGWLRDEWQRLLDAAGYPKAAAR